jgi:glutathione S-transferase
MITLHTLPAAFDMVSVSPFCTKLELYLRMRGLEYRAVMGDPRTAPKKKMPFVEYRGRTISDSQHVIDALEADAGAPLDRWLDTRQKAESHLVRRALEEGFYFVTFYARWMNERSWATYAPVYYPYLPKHVGKLIMAMLRRGVKKTLFAQGTGRHEPDEVYAFGKRDIDALADMLGDRPYVMGDEVSTLDATAFAFISSSLDFPVTTPLTEAIRARENLVRYHARIRDEFLAGWSTGVRDGKRG